MNVKKSNTSIDWLKQCLTKIFEFKYGSNLSTSKFLASGYKVFGANGVIGYFSKYNYSEPQIIISCRGENSGVINFSEEHSFITNNSIVCRGLREIDKKFFYYNLKMIPKIKMVSGSAQPQVVIQDLAKIEISFPESIQEQQKIAEILSKIDKAIAQTETLIAKYNLIKTGLMQDLLTKGIDEQGNIRSEATHEFKDSPLGKIPKEWETKELATFYKTPIRDFGSFSSTNLIEFLDEGVPFLKSEMIEVNNINWSSVSYISEKVHRKLSKSYVLKGNVLFSKIGSALGKAVVFDDDINLCNSNAAIAKIDIDDNKASGKFICEYLNSEFAKKFFSQKIVSLLPRINLGDINQLLIPLIDLKEQTRILDLLLKEEKTLCNYRNNFTKLQSLKTGLMQDLLTGKVRVNHLIKEEKIVV